MRGNKTTIFAILGAIGLIISQANFMFDDDPKTVTSFNAIIGAVSALLTALGIGGLGWFARDDDISDQEAGAGRS